MNWLHIADRWFDRLSRERQQTILALLGTVLGGVVLIVTRDGVRALVAVACFLFGVIILRVVALTWGTTQRGPNLSDEKEERAER